jgi:hypothetical protein
MCIPLLALPFLVPSNAKRLSVGIGFLVYFAMGVRGNDEPRQPCLLPEALPELSSGTPLVTRYYSRGAGSFGVHHYRHHHFPALFKEQRALESDDDDNDERQMIRHLSSNSGSLKEFRWK